MLTQLNDANFAQVNTEDTWIVMFSAPWAGPCNLVRPDFEATAGRYGNTIYFGEFCLDENPNIPEKYGVRQVPLFVRFCSGKPTHIVAGAVSQSALESLCEYTPPTKK